MVIGWGLSVLALPRLVKAKLKDGGWERIIFTNGLDEMFELAIKTSPVAFNARAYGWPAPGVELSVIWKPPGVTSTTVLCEPSAM